MIQTLKGIFKAKRGLKETLPTLDEAVFGFTTDTEELFVGSSTGNVQLAKQADLEITNGQKADKTYVDTKIGDLTTTNYSDVASGLKDHTTQLSQIVTLHPSGSNDTTAWNNAVNSVANGGRIDLVAGDYYVDAGSLKSNLTIHARGAVRLLSDTYVISADSGSPDPTQNITNVTFEFVKFEAITQTFSEFIHLLNLNGVTDILFKRCYFKGFRGDGVYLGSGAAGQERHNINIHFDKCIFDGVNFQNRNGVSIIDGDGVYFDRCHFKNCTQPNMPGAIDIEPDANAWHIIRNIQIRKCKFINIGGNTGAIGMNIPLSQSQLTTPVETIIIEGNTIDTTNNTQSGISLVQAQTVAIDNTALGLNIKVINNKAKNLAGRGFLLRGIKGAKISKNEFQNYAVSSLIGYTGLSDKCVDIKVEETTFKQGGKIDGYGLAIFTIDRLDLINNTFDDCGKSDGTYGVGIDFNTGISSNIRLNSNDFISPTNKMLKAVQKETGHTFTPSTNSVKGNHFNGLANDLQTSQTYDVDIQYEEGTWTPVLAGLTMGGTNTYSIQQGTYKRIGNMVIARCYVALSALDAALSGNILIKGLPYASAAIANGHTACAIDFQNVTFSTNYNQLLAILYPGQSQIQLAQAGSGQAFSYLGQGNINSSTFFMITATYFIA